MSIILKIEDLNETKHENSICQKLNKCDIPEYEKYQCAWLI